MRVPTLRHPEKQSRSHVASSKAAFKKARKGIKCSAECLRAFEEHKTRNASKKAPGRGFAHLGTCPLKLAAEDHRRMVSV